MDRADQELLHTRRDEAIAFFHVNQAARTAAERVFALIFSVAAIAGSVGAANDTADVAIPLPALIFLLLSYMFQQYADLTVIGRARLKLEELVNDGVGGERGLIYENAVAELRKTKPLVWSVRLLQAMMGLVVVSATAFATKVALFEDQDALIEIGYVVGTMLAAASAGYSFWHMHKSGVWTDDLLEERQLRADKMVWLPKATYSEALAHAQSDELEPRPSSA